jgi:hypothetical protein
VSLDVTQSCGGTALPRVLLPLPDSGPPRDGGAGPIDP